MRQLRVVLQPLRTTGPDERAIVSGFELGFSRLGRAVGPIITASPTTVELTCVLVTKIRKDERSETAKLATLTGNLTFNSDGAVLSDLGPVQQDASLTDVVEQDGHRRPRRKLFARLPDGTQLRLLLPDLMQVPAGFMEVMAKLTVDGDVHADVDQNEVLDVPLLPLSATNAVFHFVDGNDEALAQVTASFEATSGEQIQATTDDFGEVYLDASQGQSYTLVEVLPADDDRVAVVETSISDERTALA